MRCRIFFTSIGCATILAIEAGIAFADITVNSQEKLEPPKIQAILMAAKNHEKSLNNPDAAWQVAINYCEASRLGSIEAQYRLGMLYRFGKGVPTNQAFSGALFSLASSQGHSDATKMLDTIQLTSSALPPCVTSEVLPERPIAAALDIPSDTIDIERRIAILSDAKKWIIDLVDTIATRHQIDPKLVLAIIAVESNFNVRAQSPKDAMGLMQLIPDTADRFNIKNAFDASQNIKGGVRYLRWLLSYYHGDIRLVAAAYNAGEKAVDRYKGIPPYPETRKYVKRVLDLYQLQSHPYDEKITDPSPIVIRPG
jgi:soluble lytic murein transglycosylase-like protein